MVHGGLCVSLAGQFVRLHVLREHYRRQDAARAARDSVGEKFACLSSSPLTGMCFQIYTEAPEQLAVMVAIASGFCGFTGILEGQDVSEFGDPCCPLELSDSLSWQVYQLTLDKPAILRINHIHFHTRHIKDLLHADSLPAELYPLHLRRSIPFDLSKPEEVKQAAWALMGLMRYLQSGEAEISILKHSMRSESAEGTSESEVMKQLARFGLDGNRGRLGLKRSPPYRHRYLNCSTGSK